ncbi:MAG: C4-dicarboxylate TRAP transporter substrate-binding protein [Rhizobiales bacterium]|nr:C4-dicarboxylate TRAP transporter substrate-binding protein [Hyphomicrobiales bacterium]
MPIAAGAQQTIKLTAMDGYPPRALWVKEFIEFYIPEVDKRLAAGGKYKIEWNQAWGGQIVKPNGVLEGVENGLGDIAIITVPFFPDKLPFNNLSFRSPFVTGDPRLASKVMDQLVAKFPAFKKQYEDHNQVLLVNFSTIDSYELFSRKPVSKVADLKGLKINSAGDNLRFLEGTGAVGVHGALVEYYNNIKTGVSDGCMLWLESIVAFKINEVAPYLLKVGFGTVVNKALTVNKNTWAKLPDDVKKVLQSVGEEYRDRLADLANQLSEKSLKAYVAGGGKVAEVPQAERVAWAKGLPNLAQEWANDLDKKGLPGKAFLSAYMDAMRAGGAKPLRNWDKE